MKHGDTTYFRAQARGFADGIEARAAGHGSPGCGFAPGQELEDGLEAEAEIDRLRCRS